MLLLVLGLGLFLGSHGVRVFADDWRTRMIDRIGPGRWKGLYSLVALAGLALIVIGYGEARATPVVLWSPPAWTRHLTVTLMLLSFILWAAANGPANAIRARVGHPMVAGVKVWALAHLIANGLLLHVLLFGSMLVWAVLDFTAARRRDRRDGVVREAGRPASSGLVIIGGIVAWWLFARYAHLWLIGVNPLGGMSPGP